MSAAKRSTGRRYGAKASEKVEKAMHEMKRGELKSGRSGKTVRSRRQAVAIGLSEARREGGKVPPPPKRKAASRKAASTVSRSRGKTTARRATRKRSSS